ncbi:MFS transporter, partial [Arthrobacter sp. JCM 19049]|uniref:MFS transporter n=1 Tax=Arthrobacter sp. JCM 19049 TaxID=1460643 RepID=UPI0024371F4A
LEIRLAEAGRDVVGYSLHTPHYLAEAEYPPVAVAALEFVGAALKLALPTDSLREAGRLIEGQLAEQIDANTEVRQMVAGFEKRFDAHAQEHQPRSLLLDEDHELPDAEQIGARAESFLAGIEDLDAWLAETGPLPEDRHEDATHTDADEAPIRTMTRTAPKIRPMVPVTRPLSHDQLNSKKSWIVYTVALLAYLSAVAQRTSFGVAGLEATERFNASASILATFSVVQLLVYAAGQVPVGLILDKVGPRRMIVGGAILMTLGQAFLAFANNVPQGLVGRVLVGAGDAMVFVSVLRLLPMWFSGSRIPMLTQITGTVGQLGQLISLFPFHAMLIHVGWTPAFAMLAVIAFVSLLLVITFVHNGHEWRGTGEEDPLSTRARLAAAWRQPGTRLGSGPTSAPRSWSTYSCLPGVSPSSSKARGSPEHWPPACCRSSLSSRLSLPRSWGPHRPLSDPPVADRPDHRAGDDGDVGRGAAVARTGAAVGADRPDDQHRRWRSGVGDRLRLCPHLQPAARDGNSHGPGQRRRILRGLHLHVPGRHAAGLPVPAGRR